MMIVCASSDFFFTKTVEQIAGEEHELRLVQSGRELLEELGDHRPDVLILDVALSGLATTSAALSEWIRARPLPTLLVAEAFEILASSSEEQLGFRGEDFLTKHFAPETLRAKLDRLLARIAPSANPAERREHPRLPIDVQVTLQTIEGILHHPILNISKGGLYLESARELPAGSGLDLRFPLPGAAGLITAAGEVAWSIPIEEGLWGMGIHFTRIEPRDIDKILAYVDTLMKVIHPEGEA